MMLLLYVGEVQKAVSPVQQSEVDAQKKQAVIEQHDSIVSQYKELIREQVKYYSIDSLVRGSLIFQDLLGYKILTIAEVIQCLNNGSILNIFFEELFCLSS